MTPRLSKHKTVRQALEFVKANPEPRETVLDTECWELVARALYVHANGGDPNIVGSMGRANRAQRIILNRTTGRRRAGTHPFQRNQQQVEFFDLTGGASSGTPV